MKRILSGIALVLLAASPALAADFATIELSTTANATPEKAWSRIGDYCAIKDWLGLACAITKGNGAVGTIRELDNGRVVEMIVAKTPFSYTYIQPTNPAILYHGTLAVEPDGPGRSSRWAAPPWAALKIGQHSRRKSRVFPRTGGGRASKNGGLSRGSCNGQRSGPAMNTVLRTASR
ncbi:MAG: SRPBCC family protein [Ottowia sp.]|nr:SRPBCC family protein [Ottowia sp.]